MKMDASDTPFFKAIVISAIALVVCVLGALSMFAISTFHEGKDPQGRELERQAFEAVKAKNYSSAEDNYKKALAEAENSIDKDWRVPRVLSELADLYVLESKPDKAEAEYREAFAQYEKISEPGSDKRRNLARAKLEVLSKIATTLADQGKNTEAINQYQVALEGSNDPNLSLFDKMHVTRQYAALLRKLHRDQDAAELEADADTMTDYKGYFDSGIRNFLQGKFDLAKHQFNLQLRGARKVRMPEQCAKALTYLALCELVAGHAQQAESLCRQSLAEGPSILLVRTRHERQAEAFTVLAVSLQLEGKPKESADAINMAKAAEFGFLYPTLNYLQLEARNAVNPTVLMDAVDIVVDRAREVLNSEVLSQLELNVALHKEFEKKYKEAETRFLSAIGMYKMHENAPDAFGLGVSYCGMGRVCEAQAKYKESEKWFEQAEAQFKHTKTKYPNINDVTGCSIEANMKAAQSELVSVLQKLGKSAQAKQVQAEIDAAKH